MDRPRWIVVVRPDRPDLHAKLRQTFGGSLWVEVVLDRRSGGRRRRDLLPEAEVRAGDRRADPADPLRRGSHRLASRGEGFAIYEARGLASVPCPACHLIVWFEMPRFAEPPVRLRLDVEHEAVEAKRARHVVELNAFGPTGRLLVSSRVTGRAAAEALHEP